MFVIDAAVDDGADDDVEQAEEEECIAKTPTTCTTSSSYFSHSCTVSSISRLHSFPIANCTRQVSNSSSIRMNSLGYLSKSARSKVILGPWLGFWHASG